jgi:hypothetical protein
MPEKDPTGFRQPTFGLQDIQAYDVGSAISRDPWFRTITIASEVAPAIVNSLMNFARYKSTTAQQASLQSVNSKNMVDAISNLESAKRFAMLSGDLERASELNAQLISLKYQAKEDSGVQIEETPDALEQELLMDTVKEGLKTPTTSAPDSGRAFLPFPVNTVIPYNYDIDNRSKTTENIQKNINAMVESGKISRDVVNTHLEATIDAISANYDVDKNQEFVLREMKSNIQFDRTISNLRNASKLNALNSKQVKMTAINEANKLLQDKYINPRKAQQIRVEQLKVKKSMSL